MASGSRQSQVRNEFENYGVPTELAKAAARAYDKEESNQPLTNEESNTLKQANAIVRNNQPRYYGNRD